MAETDLAQAGASADRMQRPYHESRGSPGEAMHPPDEALPCLAEALPISLVHAARASFASVARAARVAMNSDADGGSDTRTEVSYMSSFRNGAFGRGGADGGSVRTGRSSSSSSPQHGEAKAFAVASPVAPWRDLVDSVSGQALASFLRAIRGGQYRLVGAIASAVAAAKGRDSEKDRRPVRDGSLALHRVQPIAQSARAFGGGFFPRTRSALAGGDSRRPDLRRHPLQFVAQYAFLQYLPQIVMAPSAMPPIDPIALHRPELLPDALRLALTASMEAQPAQAYAQVGGPRRISSNDSSKVTGPASGPSPTSQIVGADDEFDTDEIASPRSTPGSRPGIGGRASSAEVLEVGTRQGSSPRRRPSASAAVGQSRLSIAVPKPLEVAGTGAPAEPEHRHTGPRLVPKRRVSMPISENSWAHGEPSTGHTGSTDRSDGLDAPSAARSARLSNVGRSTSHGSKELDQDLSSPRRSSMLRFYLPIGIGVSPTVHGRNRTRTRSQFSVDEPLPLPSALR